MKNFGAFKVSLVITVFNEQDTIKDLIQSLSVQTLKPLEIIIVDGGSTDQTWPILRKFKKSLKLFQKTGNRSVGRNFGVLQSRGNIIAFTDAGCLPHPDWLQNLILPFQDSAVSVVSGYYQGKPETNFQKCLIPYVLVMPDKAGKTEFFPATRSMAVRKSVFVKSGGFAKNLDHNEDYAFAVKLKKQGLTFTFAQNALVDWLPRQNLKSSAWMFTRFAIGDIQAGIIRPQLKPLIIRYIAYIYLLFLSLSWTFLRPLLLIILICYFLFAILKNYKYIKNISALFWLPVLQITCDLSILFGSLIGFLSRIWS